MVNKTQSEKQAKKAAKGALLAEKTKIDQTHLASVGLKNLTKMSILNRLTLNHKRYT